LIIYRAAINGQLRCLPLLLERVNPFDPQNIEAMKLAFRREVVALYDADELCFICRDIAKTGFDLQIVAKELEALEQALLTSSPSTASSANNNNNSLNEKNDEKAVHQVSKALAAIRLALQGKPDGASSSKSSSTSMSKSDSSSSVSSSSSASSSSSSRPLDAKNPVEGSSDDIPMGKCSVSRSSRLALLKIETIFAHCGHF